MQLDRIAFLVEYVNGSVEDRADDIIRDSVLYDYICRILNRMMESNSCALSDVRAIVEEVTSDYREPFAGAEQRLNQALEVIVVTYYAALIKHHSEKLIEKLF